jgi:hypothetical protein
MLLIVSRHSERIKRVVFGTCSWLLISSVAISMCWFSYEYRQYHKGPANGAPFNYFGMNLLCPSESIFDPLVTYTQK